MVHGPCGGVGWEGECEISPSRCVFVDGPTIPWSGGPPRTSPVVSQGAQRMRALLASRPIVVADFPALALSAASIDSCAEVLRGAVDVVLAGDSGASRVQFPPAYRAHLIRQAGLDVWTGLNNRDRNRVALEGELAALAHVGVSGVHCVTGDHTLTGSRPDAKPVFDLDSTATASLARAAGHLVSVGEAPVTPPAARRPSRLAEKHRAGAEICFVNHAGGVEPVARFVAEARAVGADLGFIACLPIILDEASATMIRSFTTLALPPGYLEGILAAPDHRAAGIAAAIDLGRRFLDIDGVVGVDLSGGAGHGGEVAYAEAIAEIAVGLMVR